MFVFKDKVYYFPNVLQDKIDDLIATATLLDYYWEFSEYKHSDGYMGFEIVIDMGKILCNAEYAPYNPFYPDDWFGAGVLYKNDEVKKVYLHRIGNHVLREESNLRMKRRLLIGDKYWTDKKKEDKIEFNYESFDFLKRILLEVAS